MSWNVTLQDFWSIAYLTVALPGFWNEEGGGGAHQHFQVKDFPVSKKKLAKEFITCIHVFSSIVLPTPPSMSQQFCANLSHNQSQPEGGGSMPPFGYAKDMRSANVNFIILRLCLIQKKLLNACVSIKIFVFSTVVVICMSYLLCTGMNQWSINTMHLRNNIHVKQRIWHKRYAARGLWHLMDFSPQSYVFCTFVQFNVQNQFLVHASLDWL